MGLLWGCPLRQDLWRMSRRKQAVGNFLLCCARGRNRPWSSKSSHVQRRYFRLHNSSVQMHMCLLLASAAATHATAEEQTLKQTLRPEAGPGPAMLRYTRGAVPGLSSSRSPRGRFSLHFERQSLPKWIRAFLVPVRKPGWVLSHCGKVSWLRCLSSPLWCPFHKDTHVLRAGGMQLHIAPCADIRWAGGPAGGGGWLTPQFNEISTYIVRFGIQVMECLRVHNPHCRCQWGHTHTGLSGSRQEQSPLNW